MTALDVPTRARAARSVRTGAADLGGHAVLRFDVDPSIRAGALDAAAGASIAAVAELAVRVRRPLVGVLASSGADVEVGLSSLHGWGTAARAIAACSGIVPVVLVATGPVISGPALLLGLADVVIATDDAYAFVTGPETVASFTGVSVDRVALGGTGVLSRNAGVAALAAPDVAGALDLAVAVLDLLPPSTDEPAPAMDTDDDPGRLVPELRSSLPASATGSYDVRSILGAVVDDGELLELRARWAPNLVTALATLAGRPVGLVANQPQSMAGTIDIAAAQKGARFVQFCDAFNLPIVTAVDTSGFLPGKDLEWRGMIRHGAQLVAAYAEATVPRICLILRKAYGGAFIVMDSKNMGSDLCVAWPSAEVAVMGAKGAVAILERRASDDERAVAEARYEEDYLNPYVAAERGIVDAVVDPADTRAVLCSALDVIGTKREPLLGRLHSGTPL